MPERGSSSMRVSIPADVYSLAEKFLEEHGKELEARNIRTVSQLVQEALRYFVEGYKEPIIT